MNTWTMQQLITVRRAYVLESTRERGLSARKAIDEKIAEIDLELVRRKNGSI